MALLLHPIGPDRIEIQVREEVLLRDDPGGRHELFFGSPEEAEKAAHKEIEALLLGRWRLLVTEPEVQALPTGPLDEVLHAGGAEDPAWGVYADWLQAQGDPRGAELAAGLGAPLRYLPAPQSFGIQADPAIPPRLRPSLRVAGHGGLVLELTGVARDLTDLRHWLGAPECRFLNRLELQTGDLPASGLAPTLEHAGPFESLRHMTLGPAAMALLPVLQRVAPRLVSLRCEALTGAAQTWSHPRLEGLEVGPCEAPLELMARSHAPRLRRLSCYGPMARRGAPAQLPSLRTLSLRSSQLFGPSVLAHIEGILPRLEQLDVSADDAAADWLRARRDRLPRLRVGFHGPGAGPRFQRWRR